MARKSAIMSLRVIADAKNAVSGLNKAGGAVGKLGKFAKGAVGVVGGLATAIGGLAIKGGINRYLQTEDAISKLKGLGYEAGNAAKIVDDQVRPAVRGTIFATGEAANVAAGALASGIAEGEALTDYLKLTADAATQATVDFNSMGQMMNKVQGEGKLTGEVMSQMADNGLYVLPMLANEFGTTQAEMRKMVSAGEVDAATFQRVMRDNIGGAALEAGDTTRGAWANMITSFSIVGEKLVAGVMPKVREAFGMVQTGVEAVQPYAEQLGEWLGSMLPVAVDKLSAAFEAVKNYIGPISELTTAFSPFKLVLDTVTPLLPLLKDALKTVGDAALQVWEAIKPLITTLRDALIPIAANIFSTVLPPLIDGFKRVAEAVGPFVTAISNFLIPAIKFLTPIIKAVVDMILNNLIGAFNGIIDVLTGVMDFVTSVFTGNWSGAWEAVKQIISGAFEAIVNIIQLMLYGKVVSIVRGGLTAVLNFFKTAWASIGGSTAAGVKTVITWIGGLPGRALSALGNLTRFLLSKGRELINGLWNGAKNVWGSVASWIGGIPGRILSALGNVGNLLANAGRSIIDGFLGGLRAKWDGVKNFVGGIATWIADNKGPISYDRKLLKPAGTAIMTGLRESMESQMPKLKNTLNTVTREINGLEAAPQVQLTPGGRPGGVRAARAAAPVQLTVNFNGLVSDKHAVAREIKKLLKDHDVLIGEG